MSTDIIERVAVHRDGPSSPFGQANFMCYAYSGNAWARTWVSADLLEDVVAEREFVFQEITEGLADKLSEYVEKR